MNLLGTQFSYRESIKNISMRSREEAHRRIFGRDITNLEKKSKNMSIVEKPSMKPEVKNRSKSINGQLDSVVHKDPLNHYQSDILKYVCKLQCKERSENQLQINDKMRQILIDWLFDIHQSLKLKQQTLYLTLSYLNHFSSKIQITKNQYQLAGVTCLWIASKYEEIYPPRMKTYIELTADAYSLQDLKKMEGRIIQALDFNLNHITSLQLLQSMSERLSESNISFSKYLLENSLLQNLGKKYSPAIQVLASVTLADSVFKTKSDLTSLKQSAEICQENILLCFKDLCSITQNGNKFNLKAIKRKFQDQKYHNVSKIRIYHK